MRTKQVSARCMRVVAVIAGVCSVCSIKSAPPRAGLKVHTSSAFSALNAQNAGEWLLHVV